MELDIESFIPHRPPMRLVERVLSIEDGDTSTIVTCCEVLPTWPTVANGRARTLLLLEVIAQSAGVLIGWRERNEADGPGQGLLVGVKDATIRQPFLPVNTQLRCHTELIHGVTHYAAFQGTVVDAHNVKWLEASLQAFRP